MKYLKLIVLSLAFISPVSIAGDRAEDSYADIQKSCLAAWAKVTVGKGRVSTGFMMHDGSGNGLVDKECKQESCSYKFISNGGGSFSAHYVQAKNIRNHKAGCSK